MGCEADAADLGPMGPQCLANQAGRPDQAASAQAPRTAQRIHLRMLVWVEALSSHARAAARAFVPTADTAVDTAGVAGDGDTRLVSREFPCLVLAAADGSMGTTVHSREGREVREGRDDRGFAFAELREEQRDSMAQQGARTKLVRALGGSAATAHSTGTPGFGVDTPGFPGASGAASADASVVSSGVASPVKGGQMSPWILEAEALCEARAVNARLAPRSWAPFSEVALGNRGEEIPCFHIVKQRSDNLLLSIEEELRQPGKAEKVAEPPQPPEPAVQANDDHVLDEDELERVEMFEESPSKKSAQEKTSPPHDPAARAAEEKPPAKDDSAHQPFEYMVGEKVSYYSSSHGAWMPARIVERKSRTIYVIDKQMRGCLAKVRASELVSEREEEKNPVLRAFDVLEVHARAPSNRQTRPTSATRSGSSPKGRSGSPSPATPTRLPGNRGKVTKPVGPLSISVDCRAHRAR
ncbi:FEN1 [Symbiodinium sp. CCMP2592]|nr:FEN1 [Symbiodinium sp. CCMP2592]